MDKVKLFSKLLTKSNEVLKELDVENQKDKLEMIFHVIGHIQSKDVELIKESYSIGFTGNLLELVNDKNLKKM